MMFVLFTQISQMMRPALTVFSDIHRVISTPLSPSRTPPAFVWQIVRVYLAILTLEMKCRIQFARDWTPLVLVYFLKHFNSLHSFLIGVRVVIIWLDFSQKKIVRARAWNWSLTEQSITIHYHLYPKQMHCNGDTNTTTSAYAVCPTATSKLIVTCLFLF